MTKKNTIYEQALKATLVLSHPPHLIGPQITVDLGE